MWLVKQKVAPAATCTERTYAEIVHVVNGLALVEQQATVDFLHTCGYAVVRKLPPLEEMMRRTPGHVIHLGRQGLGPLAAKTNDELDVLQAELDSTGRVACLQDPEPEPVEDPADERDAVAAEVKREIVLLIQERDTLSERTETLAARVEDLSTGIEEARADAARWLGHASQKDAALTAAQELAASQVAEMEALRDENAKLAATVAELTAPTDGPETGDTPVSEDPAAVVEATGDDTPTEIVPKPGPRHKK